ncbi:MAG TPA: DUF1553 domain-containing protein, partial [Draconibacterium sp.]|nr:DUF1553 domain-containing protein [Draconibacterium sp.]
QRLPKTIIFISVTALVCLAVWLLLYQENIDYNTQVKPILNAHCISCHGGVKQNGGFSLLFEEQAKGNTKSGSPAIISGHPNQSEMIRRLISDDPEERMPYEKEPLNKEEIKILKKWIRQGAKWDTHWAYVPVNKIEIKDQFSADKQFNSWKKNDIDYFIYEKAKNQKLAVSQRADWPDLARRISFDLIGLPPPTESFEKLSNNPSEESWTLYIQELLSSKHFGEKWAGMWMDLARYSDTKGYERDDSRTIWKYRDWLINAFNKDEPHDQFLIDQIAGDLIPNRRDDQLIATAFHRNTMTNDEGGTDNEEFRVAAVIDRVNTTWEATMGTTFSCVQCHSHPYDPFKHEDYYRFMAYFNNSRDEDTFDDYPVLRHFEKEDSVKFDELKSWLNSNANQEQSNEITEFVKTWQPSINSLTSVDFVNSELSDTKWLVFRNNGSAKLKNVSLDGKNNLIFRYRSFKSGGSWKIHLDSLTGPLLKEIQVDDTKGRWSFDEFDFQPKSGTHDLYLTYSDPNLKDPQANALLFDWFHFTEQFPGKDAKGFREAKENFWYLLTRGTVRTPIMLENPEVMKRVTKVFERGNWLTTGQTVTAGVPEVMNPLPEGAEYNRLGLAKWLVDPQNPLTARTYVNRVWEQLFGTGIVETLEDFGSQGIPPTHKELLDHLAWKFMYDFHWSTKELVKYIVSSATYQQSSQSTEQQLKIDPQNKFYSRGPRIRLTAEQIRDQALVVSGLFSPKMYGPSVMPYQPDRIWNSPYSGLKWIKSEGDNQYRRAIYTYWKRTSPYPSMELFDMMPREVCTIRRIATNTPLQALVTLNDSVFVEASIQFAKRMIKEGGSQASDQIRYGYKLMMYKDISDEKLEILLKLYNGLNDESIIKNVVYQADDLPEEKHLQAMKIIGNTMFNMDEFIMKN